MPFDEFEDRSREMLAQSGQSTLNALLVMNGGATAAFLTFLTPLIEKRDVEGDFVTALGCFIAGLVAVAIAFATIHTCVLAVRYQWNCTANWFYGITFALGLLSGGCFIFGVLQAMEQVDLAKRPAVVNPAQVDE
jgi:hypothetical protein